MAFFIGLHVLTVTHTCDTRVKLSDMSDELKHQTHLAKRGSVYWFRCRVPVDLVQQYGKPDIRFSLKTKDKNEAIHKARLEALKYSQEFEHKRLLTVPPASQPEISTTEAARIAALWGAKLLAEDEEQRVHGLSDLQWEQLQVGIEEGIEHFTLALAAGNTETIFDHANDFLQEQGIAVSKDSASYLRISYAMLKEAVRVHRMMNDRNYGKVVDTPQAEPLTIRTAPKTNESMDSLEALKDYWEKQPSRTGGKKSRTALAEAETMIKKFRTMVGDLKPSEVTKGHVVALKDKMLEAGSSPATINKGRGILAAIFSTASDNDKLTHNPFEGMKKLPVPEKEEETPYCRR